MMIVSSVLGLRSFGGACFFRRVFHWSFESRGLEGAKEEQWTSFSSLKCAAALVLASASFFSDPPPLALYAALFSWHQSPVWRSTRIVLPSKSAFFNQTWWVTRFTPQQKSISIILCISALPLSSSFICNIDCGSHNQFSNWCCFLLLREFREKKP